MQISFFMEGYGREGGKIFAKVNAYLTTVEAARMKNKMCKGGTAFIRSVLCFMAP